MKYGRYDIKKELGKGAMGVVFQAHDPDIDRMVALKVLRADRMTSEDFLKRFLKEARAIGRLSHPNIVTVYDIGEDHNTIFIAMEYLEGNPLDRVIKEQRPSLGETLRIGAQIARALDYAHQRGIVHRDIKPSNIILTPEGTVKITDFGIARIEDPAATKLTQAGEILGTPVYMSPEQVMGQKVDGRSDLYSLGVILFELAAGKRPYGGKTLPSIFRAITDTEPIAPEQIDSSIPAFLSGMILKSIAKDPEDRFSSGKKFAEAMENCRKELEEKPDRTVAESAEQSTVKIDREQVEEAKKQTSHEKKSSAPILLAVAALILVAAAIGFFLWPGKQKEMTVKPPEISAPEKKPTETVKPDRPLEQKPPIKTTLLNVESDPAGANVFINGQLEGTTPLALNLSLGKYEIRLEKENYLEWKAQVELQDETPTPLFVRLHTP